MRKPDFQARVWAKGRPLAERPAWQKKSCVSTPKPKKLTHLPCKLGPKGPGKRSKKKEQERDHARWWLVVDLDAQAWHLGVPGSLLLGRVSGLLSRSYTKFGQEKWPRITAPVVAMDCCCVHPKKVHCVFVICNKWTENATGALALPHRT